VGEPIEDLELGLRLRDRLAADYPDSRVRLVPYLFSAEEDKEIEAAIYKMVEDINRSNSRSGGSEQLRLF
jgi:hypothetical protein